MRCEDLVDHGGTRLEVVEEQFTTRGTAATADGNREIKFHTEGHLLIRWGRGGTLCERQRNYEHDTDPVLLYMPGCVYNILLLCTGGIQARILSDKCSERKNLVSALLHPGFLHHWLWFAQILADTGQISREISRVNIYIIHSNTVHSSLLLEQNVKKNPTQSLWLR